MTEVDVGASEPQVAPKPEGPVDAEEARVTVAVVCRDRAHLLGECLKSLAEQTERRWEAFVVDDGSADAAEVGDAVARAEDRRLSTIRHEARRGAGAAWNAAFRAGTGEYLLALDASDRLAPGALAALSAALDAAPARPCAFSDVRLFGRADVVIRHPGPPAGRPLLFFEHSPPERGTMTRRRLWEELGGFDEAEVLRDHREGFELWVRAFAGGASFVRVHEPVYERRVLHASADVTVADGEIARYVHAKHRALYEREGASRVFLASGWSNASRAAYRRDERRRAFELGLRAWRLQPTRGRLAGAARTLLPFSANATIDAGAIRRAVPFVGYPLRGERRHRPFFVIGMGRSGNTLLRRILTSHSRLHLPPETFVLGECIRRFRREGRRRTWPDLVYDLLARFEFHPEFHLFETDLAPLAQRLARLPREDRNLAFVFDAFFRHHAETHGIACQRWGDKTPMNSLDDVVARGDRPRRIGAGVPQTLERLLEVFPDAQFLHIYRDGCDVVSSSLRGGFFDDLDEAAERWLHVESQTRRFARRHPERSIDVRYEDLVSKPEEVVHGLCDFLGVEFEPAMLTSESASKSLGDVPAWFWHAQVAEPIDASHAGKSRRLLSRSERERLQGLIGDALAELGYPPATADPG